MCPAIFDFLNSPAPRRTRPHCPYCHGVRCVGACGNNPDEYEDASICGIVRRPSELMGTVECEEGRIYNFEVNSEVGKEILSICPPGSRCQIEARHHEGTLKLVVYMELLAESP